MRLGSPITAVVAGLVAGAAGTVVMDAMLYARYRRGGGDQQPLDWEFKGVPNWEKASVPGTVGRRLFEAYTQTKLGPEKAQLTNTVMHWSYGVIWGALYGILAGSLRRPRVWLGPPFGAAVWLASYAMLPPTGLYKPIWEYDSKTLWNDLSAHLAYGAGLAAAFRLVAH